MLIKRTRLLSTLATRNDLKRIHVIRHLDEALLILANTRDDDIVDEIIDEGSALLRRQKASEGERERVWKQGCH